MLCGDVPWEGSSRRSVSLQGSLSRGSSTCVPRGQGAAELLERDRSLSRCALGMALGEAEGGVAAGTEAEDIIEVLKSERAGRHLPLKEDEITASAELLAKYVTADEVWSNLGDEDLFKGLSLIHI